MEEVGRAITLSYGIKEAHLLLITGLTRNQHQQHGPQTLGIMAVFTYQELHLPFITMEQAPQHSVWVQISQDKYTTQETIM